MSIAGPLSPIPIDQVGAALPRQWAASAAHLVCILLAWTPRVPVGSGAPHPPLQVSSWGHTPRSSGARVFRGWHQPWIVPGDLGLF